MGGEREDQATLSFLGFLINSWFLWGNPSSEHHSVPNLPPQLQAALALSPGQRAKGLWGRVGQAGPPWPLLVWHHLPEGQKVTCGHRK